MSGLIARPHRIPPMHGYIQPTPQRCAQEIRIAALSLYPLANAAVLSSGGSLPMPDCLKPQAAAPEADN